MHDINRSYKSQVYSLSLIYTFSFSLMQTLTCLSKFLQKMHHQLFQLICRPLEKIPAFKYSFFLNLWWRVHVHVYPYMYVGVQTYSVLVTYQITCMHTLHIYMHAYRRVDPGNFLSHYQFLIFFYQQRKVVKICVVLVDHNFSVYQEQIK